MLADYHVIRRRRVKVEDLYNGSPSSIYWYHSGFHWRAGLAFVLACWPFVPGFLMVLINPLTVNNWTKLFNICFLCGVALGFITFIAICLISPPPFVDQGQDFLVSLHRINFSPSDFG